jgi:thioredoxin-like negative regulator of GroEL
MAPIVDGLEAQYAGKVVVKRINANTDPTAGQYNLRGVPTYIFLDSAGTVIERQDGGNQAALAAGFQKAASKQ